MTSKNLPTQRNVSPRVDHPPLLYFRCWVTGGTDAYLPSIYAQNIRTIQVILEHIILSYEFVFTTFHTYTVPWCAGIPSLHTACKAGASRRRKTYTIQTERNSSLGWSPQWFATQTPVQYWQVIIHNTRIDRSRGYVCKRKKISWRRKFFNHTCLLETIYLLINFWPR